MINWVDVPVKVSVRPDGSIVYSQSSQWLSPTGEVLGTITWWGTQEPKAQRVYFSRLHNDEDEDFLRGQE